MSDKLNDSGGSRKRSTRGTAPDAPKAPAQERRAGSGRVSDRLANGARTDMSRNREAQNVPTPPDSGQSRKPSKRADGTIPAAPASADTGKSRGYKPKGAFQQLGDMAGKNKEGAGKGNAAGTNGRRGSAQSSQPKSVANASGAQTPNAQSSGTPDKKANGRGEDTADKTNRNDAQKGNKEDRGKKGAAGDAAKNKAKSSARGANATGVDYSDKSLKDQLEHQAADVAMDATPILGQINSARKVMKEANKKKREASGQTEDDALDTFEKGTDKVVEGGIKGAKMVVGGTLAGSAGSAALVVAMALKMLMMLKGMAVAALGKFAGFFAGIFQSISSFASSLLGIGATAANAVASGIIAVTVGAAGTLGIGGIELLGKDPGNLACAPETETVPAASQDYVEGGGDAALLQEENAGKLWSVYSQIGASKEQTAAVLGNLQHESNLDPTATETIFDEPFQMGPRKMAALNADYNVHKIDAAYGAKYPAIKHVGIGLAQWTNDRNRLLVNYAKDKGVNWYEFDTQIGFMLAGDDPGRQTQLKDFLAASPGTIDKETERFMNTWIGLSSPNPSYGDRVENATNYLFILERATADTAYAEGILSGINVDRSQGNAAAGAFQKDDGCGDTIATHYRGDKVEDGTGEVPSGLALVPWSRETFPESLKQFSVDPELAGLAWGNGSGWASGIYPGQCVGFATSYFMQLYPDWNKDGRPGTRPFGNGKDTAPGWAKHYGSKTVYTPTTGAIFSNTTSSVYGHTGIVQHVFANGDILIVEQNIRGVSGDANGMQHSWSYRVMKAERYQQDKWVFFKPEGAEPQWEKGQSM